MRSSITNNIANCNGDATGLVVVCDKNYNLVKFGTVKKNGDTCTTLYGSIGDFKIACHIIVAMASMSCPLV